MQRVYASILGSDRCKSDGLLGGGDGRVEGLGKQGGALSGVRPEGGEALEGRGTDVLAYGPTDDRQGKDELDWEHAGDILSRQKL